MKKIRCKSNTWRIPETSSPFLTSTLHVFSINQRNSFHPFFCNQIKKFFFEKIFKVGWEHKEEEEEEVEELEAPAQLSQFNLRMTGVFFFFFQFDGRSNPFLILLLLLEFTFCLFYCSVFLRRLSLFDYSLLSLSLNILYFSPLLLQNFFFQT